MLCVTPRAVSYGVPVTLHAGEWPTENGLNTLANVDFGWRELGASRIGHGIALRSDKDIATTVYAMKQSSKEKKKPVTIEVNKNIS